MELLDASELAEKLKIYAYDAYGSPACGLGPHSAQRRQVFVLRPEKSERRQPLARPLLAKISSAADVASVALCSKHASASRLELVTLC